MIHTIGTRNGRWISGLFAQHVQRHQAGQCGGDHADHDGGDVRGAEAGVDLAEEFRQQAVAGDGVGDAGLAHHHHQHHRGQAGDGADLDQGLQPRQGRVGLQRGGHRLVGAQQVVRHHAGQHRADDDVDDGAHRQRAEQADRHVALRVLGLAGGGGNRIEADVGEEHDGGRAEYAAPAELTRHAGR
ncbi:hypothetical protein G6F57_018513 [Rhizopus arrhizus]|nr:hypothetical protein G6F57_018513 [Rhizopus arrhizus]